MITHFQKFKEVTWPCFWR